MSTRVESLVKAREVKKDKLKAGYKVATHPLRSEIDEEFRRGATLDQIYDFIKKRTPERTVSTETISAYYKNYFKPAYDQAIEELKKLGVREVIINGIRFSRDFLSADEQEKLALTENVESTLNTKVELVKYLRFAWLMAERSKKAAWGQEVRLTLDLYNRMLGNDNKGINLTLIKNQLNVYSQAMIEAISAIAPQKVDEFLQLLESRFESLAKEKQISSELLSLKSEEDT